MPAATSSITAQAMKSKVVHGMLIVSLATTGISQTNSAPPQITALSSRASRASLSVVMVPSPFVDECCTACPPLVEDADRGLDPDQADDRDDEQREADPDDRILHPPGDQL